MNASMRPIESLPAGDTVVIAGNRIMINLLKMADIAAADLADKGIPILSISITGVKPVITVMQCPELGEFGHVGGWRQHRYFDQQTSRQVQQTYMDHCGCVITWGIFQGEKIEGTAHVKH